MEESLVCTICKKSWKRQRSRGRKPKICPSCISLDSSLDLSSRPSPPSPSSPTHSSEIPVGKIYQAFHPKPSNYKELLESTKNGSTWKCPGCGHVIKINMAITSPPTHKCSPNMVSIKVCTRIE